MKSLRTIHHAVLEELRRLRTTPQTILDIGCGDGAFTRAISTVFPRTAVTAIDDVIGKPFSSGNVSFKKGTAENLPFASESFDAAVAVLSLHHWDAKEKGIGDAFRVLKRGGTLIIGDPLLEDWMRHRVLGWLMEKMDGGTFLDRKTVSAYCGAAGFAHMDIRLVPQTMRSLYLITARRE